MICCAFNKFYPIPHLLHVRNKIHFVTYKLPPVLNKRYCSTTVKNSRTRGWTGWKGIITGFIPIGICLVAVMQWRAYRRYVKEEQTAKQWEVTCYCALPLNSVSRIWGWIADKKLPENLRPFVYGLYADMFGVNLSEALHEDLKLYSTLSEFFARPLKEGVRIIDCNSCIVSPCDGTVLHFGPVETEFVEQVKGVTYSLQEFLGDKTIKKSLEKNYHTTLLQSPELNDLYHCVIYLAPGDYHRFHSPVEWNPSHRKHFSGQLLSVNPTVAKLIPGLFCLNERAVYLGKWNHGFFSFTAVGATNVGSIKVYFDKTLQTNKTKLKSICKDKCLGSSVFLKKGDPLGEFRMGSTIVLIFEAPKSFKFTIKPGQRVKMGQGIGCVVSTTFAEKIEKPKNILHSVS